MVRTRVRYARVRTYMALHLYVLYVLVRTNMYTCTRVRTNKHYLKTTMAILNRNTSTQVQRRNSWALSARYTTVPTLRTVSVVVRVCGFHGWSSWLGACSPGLGAVRVSSQSRAALLTRPPVSRMDGMKLSWSESAYFAALTAA
jgi:hypothetical protein